MDNFSKKQRSFLYNKGNQCYATTVLQYLLANEEFRGQVLLKLESKSPLVANYLTKLHLHENLHERYLHQLVGMLDERFLDSKVHHDADEFLLKLLDMLELPEDMFEVFRRANVKCATPDCPTDRTYDVPEKLGKS